MDTNNEPTIESLTTELDTWRGHAKTWEDRAKENLTEIDSLKAELATAQSAGTQAETLKADLTTAQAELATLQATQLSLSVALEYGLTADDAKLLHGDEETQRALAERLKKPGGMAPDPLQGKKNEKPVALTGEQAFVALFD